MIKDIFDKYSESIDNEEFTELLKDDSIKPEDKYMFIRALGEHYKSVGISLFSKFPGIDKEINRMNNALECLQDNYVGERLWWLIEGYGQPERWPCYLYYYETDDYYAVQQIAEEYAWYSQGDDWYICPKHKWDFDRFISALEDFD